MRFEIKSGTRNLQPTTAVIERKNGKIISVKHFDYPKTKEDAENYVQRCLMMDRDFAMEGR